MEQTLTKRELEIMLLLISEKRNSEIAAELFLSKHTVDNHRKSIMLKTGCKTVIGLLKWAIGQGLVSVTISKFDLLPMPKHK